MTLDLRGGRAALALLVVLVAVGCAGGEPRGAATSPRQHTDPPAAAPSWPGPTPTPELARAVRATWGDGSTTPADVAKKLESAGYQTRYGGRPSGPPLFGAASNDIYHVGEHTVSVFVFAGSAEAEEVFQMLSARRDSVSWQGSPHFVKVGRALVVVLTLDRAAGVPLVRAITS